MADKPWKQMERRIAGFFGAKRVPGSGSMGRPDLSKSDSTHPGLFIECKARQRFEVLSVWRQAAAAAKAEGKLPIVALHALSRKEAGGDFLLIRVEDFDAVAAERLKAQGLHRIEIHQESLAKLRSEGQTSLDVSTHPKQENLAIEGETSHN